MQVSEPETVNEHGIERIDVLAEEIAVALYERMHQNVLTALVIEPPFDTNEYAEPRRPLQRQGGGSIVIAPQDLVESRDGQSGIIDEIELRGKLVEVNVI